MGTIYVVEIKKGRRWIMSSEHVNKEWAQIQEEIQIKKGVAVRIIERSSHGKKKSIPTR
jgi:hypothetical protein